MTNNDITNRHDGHLMQKAASRYLNANLNVIPLNREKTPICKWKRYQDMKIIESEIDQLFINAASLGVVCGKISGNLEVIDVDCKYDLTGKLWESFSSLIKVYFSKDFFESLAIARTVNDGYHIYYRCISIDGNAKLAQRPANDEEKLNGDSVKVLIETRGEGGYVVAEPTDGYKWIQNNYDTIPVISQEQRLSLHAIAKSFHKIDDFNKGIANGRIKKNNDKISSLDDYNRSGDCISLLINHGWSVTNYDQERTCLLRPGQTSSKVSGNFHDIYRKLIVFSTSTGFEAGRAYSPSDVYAILECNGDISVAAKKLYDAGFGDRRTKKTSKKDDDYEEKPDYYKMTTDHIKSMDFRFNKVTGVIELDGRPLQDVDISVLMHDLRTTYKYPPGKATCEDIIVACSMENEYNPFEDYVKKHAHLKSTGNIDKIIHSIEGAIPFLSSGLSSSEYRSLFIGKYLIGFVSGLFNEYSLLTLVLVGPQGSGKTKWFRDLLPEELKSYYAEAKFDDDKDTKILLTQKALVVDDEFTGKTKKEAGLFKQLSSTSHFTLRLPYGKRSVIMRRIAALGGTTNDCEIFNDPTGNRRIIPVQVDKVDWEMYNSVDKDELFMEIYRELKSGGDSWMLTKEDIDILNHYTQGYESICPEEEMIRKYFKEPKNLVTLKSSDYTMTNTDILNFLQARLNGSSLKLKQKTLGGVLKKLGYQQVCRDGARLYAVELCDDAKIFYERDAEKDDMALKFARESLGVIANKITEKDHLEKQAISRQLQFD